MRARWDWSVLGGWVVALVVFRAARMTERDPYWQARDGIERWAATPLVRPDSWSWTRPEGTFRPTSPAWNSALGFGFDGLGVAGIALVGAVGMLAYFAAAVLLARRLRARPLPTLLAVAVVALLALPMVSPRATIAVQALLLITLALGHALVHSPLPSTPWTFVGVVLAGAALGWSGVWLHVSWAVTAWGLAAALPALAVLTGASRRRVGLALAAGSALALGTLLGPYGVSVWQLLLDVSSASDGQIIEWLPPFTEGLRARWLPVAALCLALPAACALRLVRSPHGALGSAARSRWALEVVLVAISLTAAVAGLFAIRFLGVAALTLLPVLAAEMSAATVRWRSSPRSGPVLRTRLTAAYWRPILTGVLVVLLPFALVKANDPGRPTPEADLSESLPRGCHLFADPDSSGAVLLLRPDVLVSVDMRTEVHGSAAYTDTRDRLADLVDVALPAGTTCALLPASAKAAHIDDGPSGRWVRRSEAEGLSLWLPA